MDTHEMITEIDHGKHITMFKLGFKKPKRKPYWIEVENCTVKLIGRNGFEMLARSYFEHRQAIQMAKRLAKNLCLEFRQ